MAKSNYKNVLKVTLKWEGGYSNHPQDPGGATQRGIIQKVYDKWRDKWGKPRQSVKNLTETELQTIYKEDYWIPVQGDRLKHGVDLVCFDGGVNSGVGRNGQWVGKVLNTNTKVHLVTNTEVDQLNRLDPVFVVKKYMDLRLSFLQGLSTFKTFGRGWTNRVADVRANALAMASKGNPDVLLDDAKVQDKKTAQEASNAVKTATGTIPTSAAASGATTVAGFDWTPIIAISGIVLLVGLTVAVVYMIKSNQHKVVAQALKDKAQELINGRA